MAALHDPEAVRALTRRLIAFESVSPDPVGEARCARILRESLPAGVESGTWQLADGRPVVWALARGRSSRTVLMLGHYDTVGFGEYAVLGDADIARDPARLRERFLEPASLAGAPEQVRRDLDEERRSPGTWLFGRGAFDMKSGLAAGIAALGALAADAALEANVLLVMTPDEENASAGMKAAVGELLRMRERLKLEFLGAINLDSVEAPVAYSGVMGKQLAGLWILGRPVHAGSPFGGVDAAQVAAEIVTRATRTDLLADAVGDRRGPPAVALRLRDLKQRYDVQTTTEAEVELNLITFERTLERTFERVREIAASAVAQVMGEMGALRSKLDPGAAATGDVDPGACVLVWPELLERAARAGQPAPRMFLPRGLAADRDGVRGMVRDLATRTRVGAPAVVVYLGSPFYPAAAPGSGPLPRAARAVLDREGLELRDWYPLITDASYVRWASPDPTLARWMPDAPDLAPPAAEAAELDLDVVTLGPWGRDAHGLYERVNAPYAFERLPRLLVDVVRATLGTG